MQHTSTAAQRGFTLIELLVVIAIIGILSSVVLASLSTARIKGRDARRLSDVKQLQLALELYYDSHSTSYPTTAQGLAVLDDAPTPAIPAVPSDPSSGSYQYAGITSAGASCTTAGTCTSYVIKATMENDVTPVLTGTIGGVNCSSPVNKAYCVRP